MDIIQNVGIFLEILHGIHAAVVEVAGVKAEACDLIGHVLHIAGDLIGKLDVGAGVRVDHGTDAPAVGALADCADMAHELLPLLIVHAGCAVIVAGIEITLIVAPVHNGHVGSRELLAFHNRKLGEPGICDQPADVVHCLEDRGLIRGIDQIMENGSCHDCQLILLKFSRDDFRVDGHVAVRSELDRSVACLMCFGKDFCPGNFLVFSQILSILSRRPAPGTRPAGGSLISDRPAQRAPAGGSFISDRPAQRAPAGGSLISDPTGSPGTGRRQFYFGPPGSAGTGRRQSYFGPSGHRISRWPAAFLYLQSFLPLYVFYHSTQTLLFSADSTHFSSHLTP